MPVVLAGDGAEPGAARGDLGSCRTVHQAAGRGEPVTFRVSPRTRHGSTRTRGHPRAPVPAHRRGRGQGPGSAHWMLLRRWPLRDRTTCSSLVTPPADLRQLRVPRQPRHQIRGRSSRLTLTYRSTDEILTAASRYSAPNPGTTWTTERTPGRVPVCPPPPTATLPRIQKRQEELDGILRQLREWTGDDASIAVSMPTSRLSRSRPTWSLTTCPPAQLAPTARVGTTGTRRDPPAVQGPGIPADDPRRDHRRGGPGQRIIADPTRQHHELMRARRSCSSRPPGPVTHW